MQPWLTVCPTNQWVARTPGENFPESFPVLSRKRAYSLSYAKARVSLLGFLAKEVVVDDHGDSVDGGPIPEIATSMSARQSPKSVFSAVFVGRAAPG